MAHLFNYLRSDNRPVVLFESAEEAWFWCCFCESSNKERRNGTSSEFTRPCETSDILLAVKRLVAESKLTQTHVRVLSKYGLEQTPPHPNFGDSLLMCRIWDEGIRMLSDSLRTKGIVGYNYSSSELRL